MVVEDIIKKLPGVEVKESGKIAYQGKEISRFYIEGLDMLGSGYTVASKNINVDDVRSIEIYENHQHIKALQEIQRPDAAAMNITLKEDAKGTWTGSLAAGVGYKPWMWRGNAALMYFGKKMQSINTYKTNNMGDNVAREFGYTNNNETIIGIRFPTVPPLNERLYINNNVHAVTSNFLFKLSETLQMKLNAWYVHDYRKSKGVSQTVHNIVGEAPVVIDESMLASEKSDRVNLDLKIENNKEKSYLNNTLYFNGDFSEDFGCVTSNGSPVNQSFGLPSLSTGNNLQMIIPVAGKFSLNLSSRIAYKRRDNSLKIKPMLFPDIFGDQASDNAIQTLNSSQFITQNSLFGNYNIGRWNIAVGIGIDAHVEDMMSKLYSGSHTENVDSMRNDINWQRYDITIGPRISYKVNDIFSITASVNADLMHLQSRDKVRGQTDRIYHSHGKSDHQSEWQDYLRLEVFSVSILYRILWWIIRQLRRFHYDRLSQYSEQGRENSSCQASELYGINELRECVEYAVCECGCIILESKQQSDIRIHLRRSFDIHRVCRCSKLVARLWVLCKNF